jgi:hypothetical protein
MLSDIHSQKILLSVNVIVKYNPKLHAILNRMAEPLLDMSSYLNRYEPRHLSNVAGYGKDECVYHNFHTGSYHVRTAGYFSRSGATGTSK